MNSRSLCLTVMLWQGIVVSLATAQSFTWLPVHLGGTTNDVAVPGDFDNDGHQDLFVSGSSPTGRVSRLYRNLGNGTFADSQISLPTLERGEAVVWGDFNNDNFLDLALGGPLDGTNVIQILRGAQEGK